MGTDYLAEKRLTSQLETLIISMYWYLLYPFPLMRYQSMRGFLTPVLTTSCDGKRVKIANLGIAQKEKKTAKS